MTETETTDHAVPEFDRCSLCPACHHDEHHFACCRCGVDEHTDHQNEIGCLLAVAEGNVEPGLYVIQSHPYYAQPTIGHPHLYAFALRKLSDDLMGCETDDYPCGHVCRTCAAAIRETLAGGGAL